MAIIPLSLSTIDIYTIRTYIFILCSQKLISSIEFSLFENKSKGRSKDGVSSTFEETWNDPCSASLVTRSSTLYIIAFIASPPREICYPSVLRRGTPKGDASVYIMRRTAEPM